MVYPMTRILFLFLSFSHAFHEPTRSRPWTQLYGGDTKQPHRMRPPAELSYGEESRKYRRTVFTHDDWVQHRSPDRFIKNIITTPESGIYKNVGREIVWTVGVATFVFLWNMIVAGYHDFAGLEHGPILSHRYLTALQLPLTPFTLASPSLGLLLVFRTNTAYQRWDEARKSWEMNINHSRDLVRLGNAYYDRSGVSNEQRKKDLQRLALTTWAFARAMQRHLSPKQEDEDLFRQELSAKLPPGQAKAIVDAVHRPNRALFDLSMAIENLPMHFMRKNEMHRAVTVFENSVGGCERLLNSPVPLFYSRHTARFLAFWLLLLPFALYEPFSGSWNHIGMIPATAVISLFLFGTEELATQKEEPFTILPMQTFSDDIYNSCTEIIAWEDGDNGLTTRPTDQGLSYEIFQTQPNLEFARIDISDPKRIKRIKKSTAQP